MKLRFPEHDFERFMKKKVAYDEGDRVPFTGEEYVFLEKLIANNMSAIYEYTITKSSLFLELYQVYSDDDNLRDVYVYKTSDDWFLIYDTGAYIENTDTAPTLFVSGFVADEFTEVKGFFAKYTTFQF